MAKGDFSNLKGAGKPLQYQNHNPFVDIATHKINQVLCNKFQTLFEQSLEYRPISYVGTN